MPTPYTIALAVVLVMMLALIANSEKAHSASGRTFSFCVVELKKCKTVTLPPSGKCKIITFHGRKIKICTSSGEGSA